MAARRSHGQWPWYTDHTDQKGGKHSCENRHNISDESSKKCILCKFHFYYNSIPLSSIRKIEFLLTSRNLTPIPLEKTCLKRQVWAVYPAGQLLELAEAELRASLERNIDVWRRAWQLEVPIPVITVARNEFWWIFWMIFDAFLLPFSLYYYNMLLG